jgi:hypothetical protein
MTSDRRCAAGHRSSAIAVSLRCQRIVILSIALVAALHATAPTVAAEIGSAREEAVRAIPWRQLSANDRRAAQLVVKNPSIYRRLPTRVIDCDPELFTFLLEHPEVVIDVWRVMGVSQVTLDKLPAAALDSRHRYAAYRATDGCGTVGTVRYLHADWSRNGSNLAVVFADGSYEGKPFFTPLRAQSVLLIRSGAVQETSGRHYVTVRIDTFLKIEQMGIELVAKTVQPWISKTTDRNFIETLTFVSNFSRTAEKNPQGMQRLATRLNAVDEPTRNELVALCFRTAERYAQRDVRGASAALLAHRANSAGGDAQWIQPFAAQPATR